MKVFCYGFDYCRHELRGMFFSGILENKMPRAIGYDLVARQEPEKVFVEI